MNRFIKVNYIIIFITCLIQLNATTLYFDILHPAYISYYYDKGDFYEKAGKTVFLFSNQKFINLKEPELNNSLSNDNANSRMVLVSHNESWLKPNIKKSDVIHNLNLFSLSGQNFNSIIALNAPYNKDYLCINELPNHNLNIFNNELCFIKIVK